MNLRPFRRVLVANRGEIAVRIIRGCHESGLEAVAVHSDVDRTALHVRLADAAFEIGPAPSSQSYLVQDKILDVARRSGADAIHPGYGFLSENAAFAQRVIDAGLVWIGPPPGAIDAMGSKTAARSRMIAAGVPVVPGTTEAISDLDELVRIAAEVGYPVMLKAAAGGGGKGMRRVEDPADLVDAFTSAASEAQKSFGDAAVYLEKLVVRPRHVEIQVLADGHGSCVHLFDRDCSIQRRNQKVFEEAPSPAIDAETRAKMGQMAVQAAQAVGYVGAGTIECLFGEDGSFYFLEMNTRLQVEHPITESITGIDLVRAQLRIAAGEPLGFAQSDLHIHGHAVECRVYAEDARANFRPSPGPLRGYREPNGPWVRVDSGVVEGMDVPVSYDPMVSKLVVWGQTREEALDRAARALKHYRIVGIPTSIPFFLALMRDPAFRAGKYSTAFIQPQWLEENLNPPDEVEELAAIASAIGRYEADQKAKPIAPSTESASGWATTARIAGLRRGWA